MTFPAVLGRATGRTTAVDTTTHAITLPAGILRNEKLVVVFSCDAAPTVSVNTALSGPNWTKVGQASNGVICTGAVFEKFAQGNDVLSLTTTSAEQSSHVSLRISNAAAVSGTPANGSSTNSNPPSHTPVGGAKDYLWIVSRSGDSTPVASAAPASFANLQTLAGIGTAAAGTNTAERSLNAASLDPAAFTSAVEQWVAWTIAVTPARIITLGSTDVPSGPGVNSPAVNIPVTAAVMLLVVDQIGWPHTGEECGWFKLSCSVDGGAYEELMSSPITDVPEVAVKTFPPDQLRFAASLPVGTTRQLRFDWNFDKPLTLSGYLDAW